MAVHAISSMAPSLAVDVKQSPWNSPVPYLFGGLAAMFGLLAFALLIVVYSYWKLSGNIRNGDGDAEYGNGDGNSKPENSNDYQLRQDSDEKYLVIMAGEEKPRYLATPV
ncbi:protein GLUTAMINE DUMPER 1-like [Cynara cardunculus var. scolymus]|uniref:protein GLUTAMINE DUMPER 1-like n=1 Tax=Cynara cardunculus var. scolymus TaxID=59895 RepID=UPI000D62B0AB|nr:protein GLUTAMINE DUMPER 1-like [Cynara cardunculus var. scolymus]